MSAAAMSGGLTAAANSTSSPARVAWKPQAGSQTAFLACPVTEALYEGGRGPGKTDAFLMDFAQFTGRGFGAWWRGILFRRTFPELSDVIVKARRWFSAIFPEATYNASAHEWRWPTGETLLLRFMERPADYYRYHGHEYPWIGFEELTTWPTPECYTSMFSCLRSSNPHVPRRMRATTNPYGIGHGWVKKRFRLPVPPRSCIGPVITTPGEPDRVAIHGSLSENKILLAADPGYEDRIRASAANPSQAAAWLAGDWDIVAGGMFDDAWNAAIHVLPPIPLSAIPSGWRLDRSYDHGSAKPFSVGWWAQSNGEPVMWEGCEIGPVRGDLIRVVEWYGCRPDEPDAGLQMPATEIADGILERERAAGVAGIVRPGPADTAIYAGDQRDPTKTVAGDMASRGVTWERADKSPGSRHNGWRAMRDMLKAAIPNAEGYREKPGLFVTSACPDFIRTIPALPRHPKDLDDVDTTTEDHIADETRYRVTRATGAQSFAGAAPRVVHVQAARPAAEVAADLETIRRADQRAAERNPYAERSFARLFGRRT